MTIGKDPHLENGITILGRSQNPVLEGQDTSLMMLRLAVGGHSVPILNLGNMIAELEKIGDAHNFPQLPNIFLF